MADIKNILFDFDGVILDSMAVRDKGFEIIFQNYPKNSVEKLMDYHRTNGGLSRYVKIKYFFEEILGKSFSNAELTNLAIEFSQIMRKELVNSKLLIKDSVNFIKGNFTKYNMHIVSGSDQEELRFLCRELGLSQYFTSIHGSPTPKINLVSNLLLKTKYNKASTCLIGDSVNDLEAAQINQIIFFGYNNPFLRKKSTNYIETFDNF